MIVWVDGEFLDAERACVPVDDRGFTLGDGLFETMLVADGDVRRAAAHWARLASGCAQLGFADGPPISLDAMRSVLVDLARRNALETAAARMTVTRGSGPRGLAAPSSPHLRLVAAASPAPLRNPTLSLSETRVRRAAGSVAATCKTVSYADNVAALAEARAAGADEALVLDAAGAISGAAAANVFWIKDGRAFTPSLDGPVLAGTTRAALTSSMNVEEGAFGVERLASADAAFLTNALIGVAPVSELRLLDGSRAVFDAGHPLIAEMADTERAAV